MNFADYETIKKFYDELKQDNALDAYLTALSQFFSIRYLNEAKAKAKSLDMHV